MIVDEKKEAEKLPRGWKRDENGDPVSPEQWNAKYCIRAVVIPVASPAEFGKGSKEAWQGLRAQLKEAWTKSTEAANWAMRTLLANDVQREPGQVKCPKMPKIYLYGLRNWDGWSQSAAAVLRTVEAKYRACRYQVVWTGGASLPNVRYPYPYPVHNAGWKLYENPDGGLYFEARLPSGRVQMRLKGGHQLRRQLAGARHLIENPHLRGEAAIYQRGNEIVVKLVGWFPKRTDETAEGTMFVRTDSAAVAVGLNDRDERLFVINGDRCKRWIVRGTMRRQRWAEDQKYELRNPKRKQRKTFEDMRAGVMKNNNRVSSFVDETAAQIVNHCKRRRLACIRYDDSDQSYLDGSFPWFRLRTLIEQKANAEGITFEWCGAAEDAGIARKDAKTKEEIQ